MALYFLAPAFNMPAWWIAGALKCELLLHYLPTRPSPQVQIVKGVISHGGHNVVSPKLLD